MKLFREWLEIHEEQLLLERIEFKDEEIQRAMDGDSEALSDLSSKTVNYVRRILGGEIYDQDTRDDIAQNVMVAMFRQMADEGFYAPEGGSLSKGYQAWINNVTRRQKLKEIGAQSQSSRVKTGYVEPGTGGEDDDEGRAPTGMEGIPIGSSTFSIGQTSRRPEEDEDEPVFDAEQERVKKAGEAREKIMGGIEQLAKSGSGTDQMAATVLRWLMTMNNDTGALYTPDEVSKKLSHIPGMNAKKVGRLKFHALEKLKKMGLSEHVLFEFFVVRCNLI
jgi:DNA-directed RNA polymerase specialized sigma24 family protein